MPQTGKGRGTARRMPPVLFLFSLLLGTLEVSAAPFEKGVRPEEMVTRCIVEVLSNALAKPNAPAIDPECKEILSKNSRYGIDEAENEQKPYETRNLKDYASEGKHKYESSEEIKRSANLLKEENEIRHSVDNTNREESEEERLMKLADEKEESTGHSKERHLVDDDNDDDDDNEKRGDHKDHNEKGEIIKKDKYHNEASREAEHNGFDKKGHHSAKSDEESSKENDEDPRKLEEMKRHFVSQSSKEQLLHPDKHSSAHSNEVSEESVEREDEKRSYKPMLDEYGQRLMGYEEKRSHLEQGNHITSDRGQKSHYDHLENGLKKSSYDKRPHSDKESSEESREKTHQHQGIEEEEEEEREQHYSRDRSSEKALNGHHYEEKRYHEETKRWPSQPNLRLNYEESNEDSKESEEDINRFHERDRLDKDKFYRKLRHHIQDSEEDESYKHEKKQEDKRHYVGEEMVDEMKRYYPEFSHDKERTHYNEENSEESNNLDNEKNKRHHSEEERLFHKYGLSDDPLRWKGRYYENHDNSKEERKRSFQKMFPDYGDYELWSKRQFLDDMNHEYGEKGSPLKFHKFEEKRQQDRMDELAQLLNYKKKSVEFPDFYDSQEIKKRHYNERLSQRPLTEEEEKELKNLAIMDMELQKIAEKLSNNRQG